MKKLIFQKLGFQHLIYKMGGGIILTLLFVVFSITPSNGQCDGRRPDIYDFSEADRQLLRNLIMDYFNSDIDNSQPGILRYTPIGVHSGFTLNGSGGAGWHNRQEEFLTWHRNYIQELENYLLSLGYTQFVPLPAWHNADPIPDEFFNDSEVMGCLQQYPKQDY